MLLKPLVLLLLLQLLLRQLSVWSGWMAAAA
jgi:hypothetical protein